ncbi:hypothetical protein NSK_008805 [Nannochloropsis salina CCMP1776]|uniref:Uncharacterized protein n=1 Tax=Nannochloropsis salina CCMP1776 TaxID=1027361 RepID=A0A4D9CLA1_9STRA|nr:hypothetical protein NSK_008805 [Nannochloropsis salina CCMP1776]|eukprot:TFJ79871.1 hypothetical protein NSK_008805 [Nannochloropsis salina CCMP1776]
MEEREWVTWHKPWARFDNPEMACDFEAMPLEKRHDYLIQGATALDHALTPLPKMKGHRHTLEAMLQLVRDDFETQRPMSEDARLAWRSALELTRRNRGPKVDEVFKCVVDCLVFLLHTRRMPDFPRQYLERVVRGMMKDYAVGLGVNNVARLAAVFEDMTPALIRARAAALRADTQGKKTSEYFERIMDVLREEGTETQAREGQDDAIMEELSPLEREIQAHGLDVDDARVVVCFVTGDPAFLSTHTLYDWMRIWKKVREKCRYLLQGDFGRKNQSVIESLVAMAGDSKSGRKQSGTASLSRKRSDEASAGGQDGVVGVEEQRKRVKGGEITIKVEEEGPGEALKEGDSHPEEKTTAYAPFEDYQYLLLLKKRYPESSRGGEGAGVTVGNASATLSAASVPVPEAFRSHTPTPPPSTPPSTSLPTHSHESLAPRQSAALLNTLPTAASWRQPPGRGITTGSTGMTALARGAATLRADAGAAPASFLSDVWRHGETTAGGSLSPDALMRPPHAGEAGTAPIPSISTLAKTRATSAAASSGSPTRKAATRAPKVQPPPGPTSVTTGPITDASAPRDSPIQSVRASLSKGKATSVPTTTVTRSLPAHSTITKAVGRQECLPAEATATATTAHMVSFPPHVTATTTTTATPSLGAEERVVTTTKATTASANPRDAGIPTPPSWNGPMSTARTPTWPCVRPPMSPPRVMGSTPSPSLQSACVPKRDLPLDAASPSTDPTPSVTTTTATKTTTETVKSQTSTALTEIVTTVTTITTTTTTTTPCGAFNA